MTDIGIPVYQEGEIRVEDLDLDRIIATAFQTEEDRYKQLQAMEWQRWMPVVGVYRLIKDNINGDQKRLNAAHSRGYEIAINIYNILQGSALLTGAVVGLQQLVEKF